jgi:hypothetical protein
VLSGAARHGVSLEADLRPKNGDLRFRDWSLPGTDGVLRCSQFSPGYILGRLSVMTLKLSQELADALNAAGKGELEVVNPNDNRVYFLVDGDTHRQAMDALRRQRDRDAIANGIAQMEAGEDTPLEEARKQTRERLLSREQ